MPRKKDLADRRARVLELRRAGVTYRQIAQTLGCDVATVHRDHRLALDELVPVEDGEQVRRAEVDRMDAVRMGLWKQVVAGDLGAVSQYLAVSRRLSHVSHPVEAEVLRLVQSLRSGVVSTGFEARAALALALARTIDAGDEKPAPIAKELRALIGELLAEVGGIDDDAFGDVLQAQVRNS